MKSRATSWMARREIDASRTSPRCSTRGDTPLRRIRHALGRTAPRRGARRPPPMSCGARQPPLGDELEEMAELSRRRPPSPSAEQCAQEARGHLVPVALKSTQSCRGAAPTARPPLLLVVIRVVEGAGHGRAGAGPQPAPHPHRGKRSSGTGMRELRWRATASLPCLPLAWPGSCAGYPWSSTSSSRRPIPVDMPDASLFPP
jgi:hypothetical protein